MSEALDAEVMDEHAVVPRSEDALVEFGRQEIGLERAMLIANQLDAIIAEKGLAVRIGQGEHLRVEAWCACASMVGVSPRTVWTRRIPESGALEGYIARVEVVQISTGQVIGAAEAGCFMDERQGNRQRWTEQHAVMSMAQTRATSKSIGQVLRWIPVLAGYSGTPAEEMPREAPSDEPRERKAPPVQQGDRQGLDTREATEKQFKMFYAVSMARAKTLLEECIANNKVCAHADEQALSGSIRKHALEAVGLVKREEIQRRHVDHIRAAIERAVIGENGETVIPDSEPF